MATPAERGFVVRAHEDTAARSTHKPVKIVVTGPFSAGKTTLIRTISEITVLGTERDVTDESAAIKPKTTVAMDFGRISVEGGYTLHLFGTPGQQRFDVMWEILSEGMIAFILLVRADDPRSLEESRNILQAFRSYADVPHVVGVTHIEDVPFAPEDILAATRSAIGAGPGVPVVACDPRSKDNVKDVLLTALVSVLERLELRDGSAGSSEKPTSGIGTRAEIGSSEAAS